VRAVVTLRVVSHMSIFDDEDLDEGEVPPLLGVADLKLDAAAAAAAPPAAGSRQVAGTAEASRPAAATKPVAAAAPAAAAKPAESGGATGGGLKKGFLSGGGTPRKSGSSSKAAAAPVSGGGGATSAKAELPVLHADKSKQKQSLELPEIKQQREAEVPGVAAQGGSDGWVTPDLMKKIGASPILRKAFTDPRCQEAMTALQTDPAAAMKKYGDSAEMREFLQAFMKLMGEHFSALADQQEAAKSKAAAAAAPPVVAKSQTAEERAAEEAAAKAMQDPEVVAILQEPQVQAILQKLQLGHSHELEAAMRSDPKLVGKLRKLSQAGLIGMHWAP